MPSEVTKIGPKYQVTIPKAVRDQLGLKVGDLVQARVGKDRTIIMERKRLVDFDAPLEDDLAASAEDSRRGRVLGPFTTAKEAVTALKDPPESNLKRVTKITRTAAGHVVKPGAHARRRNP
jgi:AbrB family looped-hinge helix DNA binding protein